MNEEYLEVNFEKYCKTCQHKELEEKFDPCNIEKLHKILWNIRFEEGYLI